jgi:hypothetical protein
MKRNDIFIIEQKISTFCRKKGWDVDNLSTEQILIIFKNIENEKNKNI